MDKLKKYLKSIEFLSIGLCNEYSLIQNINPKFYKYLRLNENPIFIKIKDLDLYCKQKNEIITYPMSISFCEKKNHSVTIPVFVNNIDILTLMLNSYYKYETIEIKNIGEELTEDELLYYYQIKYQLKNLLDQ